MIQFSPQSCSENICSAALQLVIEINGSNGHRLGVERKKVHVETRESYQTGQDVHPDWEKSLRKQQDGHDLQSHWRS